MDPGNVFSLERIQENVAISKNIWTLSRYILLHLKARKGKEKGSLGVEVGLDRAFMKFAPRKINFFCPLWGCSAHRIYNPAVFDVCCSSFSLWRKYFSMTNREISQREENFWFLPTESAPCAWVKLINEPYLQILPELNDSHGGANTQIMRHGIWDFFSSFFSFFFP